MVEFMYQIRPTRLEMLVESTPEEDALIEQHFEYLQRLTQAGVARLAGRTLTVDEGSFGIVIFWAEDEAAAREVMRSDPAVAAGVFAAQLFPFRTALMGK